VDAEGVRRLTNYDIFAKAGGAMRATTEVLRVTVTDGVLNLFFSKGTADNPLVSAIEVVPVATAARLAETAETPETGQIILYPNPVRDRFTVTLPFAATQVRGTAVTNAAGKVYLHNAHRESGEREIQVSAGTLPKGLYLLRLDTEEGYRVIKFARQ
jgi:hypothetical protein